MPRSDTLAEATPAATQRRHWSLAVLCLLRERPMHPYEMRRLMRQRHKDDRLVLKPGSLYNAVAWLLQQGLIEAAGTRREGRRPRRTIYRLLPAGERQLTHWLGSMLEEVEGDVSSFAVALDHLVHLAPGEAAEHLRARRASLEAATVAKEATLREHADSVGRVNLLEVDYDLARLRAQHDWLGRILRQVEEEALHWDTGALLKSVRALEGSSRP